MKIAQVKLNGSQNKTNTHKLGRELAGVGDERCQQGWKEEKRREKPSEYI